ncbi:MAG: dihydrofolate reductase family protein [Terracidiphilus sp.]|jgi:dihydrofolate reductase
MMPHICAIAATSIDGRIGRDSAHVTDWTSPEDKASLYSHLAACDAVVVGNNTYKITPTLFAQRTSIVFTKSVQYAEAGPENTIFFNPANGSLETLLGTHRKVAVLGGSQTYSYFFQLGLIDELYLTIEPILFGKGLPLVEYNGVLARFAFQSVTPLNKTGTLLIHYKKAGTTL